MTDEEVDVCDFCGMPIEEDGQQCYALPDGFECDPNPDDPFGVL